jgi:uncharacterized membrane protein
MRLFNPGAHLRSAENNRVYALYELARTIVDFLATMFFTIGSVFFFWEDTVFAATWLFVLGSLCFMLKPTLRLARELQLAHHGNFEQLAERAQ